MTVKHRLQVTFTLDGDAYQVLGENMMSQARQDAYELIFKRAEMNVLETLLKAAAWPSGDPTQDQLLRDCLEEDLNAIRSAAATATYQFVETLPTEGDNPCS